MTMKINSKQSVAGFPIFKMREMFKKCDLIDFDIIQRYFNVSKEQAMSTLKILITEGYIESEYKMYKNFEMHRVTELGKSLARAKALPSLTREKADSIFKSFLERVNTVNSSDNYLYNVASVEIFGSYNSNFPKVNDIDIIVDLQSKFSDPEITEMKHDEKIEDALQNGKRFKNTTEMYCWPEIEVWAFLRNKSPYLSLHSKYDSIVNRVQPKLIFQKGN